jgi:hypothetical protein
VLFLSISIYFCVAKPIPKIKIILCGSATLNRSENQKKNQYINILLKKQHLLPIICKKCCSGDGEGKKIKEEVTNKIVRVKNSMVKNDMIKIMCDKAKLKK